MDDQRSSDVHPMGWSWYITLGEHVCTITRGDGYVHLCMTSPEVMLYAHEVHTWYMTRGHVLHTCDVQGHPMPMDHWSWPLVIPNGLIGYLDVWWVDANAYRTMGSVCMTSGHVHTHPIGWSCMMVHGPQKDMLVWVYSTTLCTG